MEINWLSKERSRTCPKSEGLKLISSMEESKKVRNKIAELDASIKMVDGW